MSVNGITSTTSTYDPYQVTQPSTKPAQDTGAASGSTPTKEESGVVYEPSKENPTASAQKYTQNTELVNKLKADAESHT